FGNTPEMIAFFSDKLGVDFPWPKYAQIVGRDYVSGAMENTTATLHQEIAIKIITGNYWMATIGKKPLPMNYFTNGLATLLLLKAGAI
ncbi:MAG: hypothetical protein IPI36_13645, partial [Chitinophagaceae bacterium]|nr:hypothetical protein [Chitinophagaceae bacterium]